MTVIKPEELTHKMAEHHADDHRSDLPLEERAKLHQCPNCPALSAEKKFDETQPPAPGGWIETLSGGVPVNWLKKLAERRVMPRPTRPSVKRPWSVAFFMKGITGQLVPVTVAPQVLFRGDRLEISDSLDGAGTKIGSFLLGCRMQFPTGWDENHKVNRTLTKSFAKQWLGPNGEYHFDTIDPALMFTIEVEFVEDCEFRAEIFGTAMP